MVMEVSPMNSKERFRLFAPRTVIDAIYGALDRHLYQTTNEIKIRLPQGEAPDTSFGGE